MTYYCTLCRRITPAYDLWPDHTCITCSGGFDDVLDTDRQE